MAQEYRPRGPLPRPRKDKTGASERVSSSSRFQADCSSGIVREKEDGELYSIDEVGGVVEEAVDTTAVEPPKKRRRPLRVDEILGTETKPSIPSHIPKSKRPANPSSSRKNKPVEQKDTAEQHAYDVWNKVTVIPAPENLPPPATLAYSIALPAQAPATLRSSSRLLRPRGAVEAVQVAEGGQSYNPALEDWEDLISRTANKEEERLAKIAFREWVPVPPAEEAETPNVHDDDEEEDEEGETQGETYLGRPVKVKRKTQAQRNKLLRQKEHLRLRQLAQSLKSKHKQIASLPSLLADVALRKPSSGGGKPKKPKELPVAPLEVQLSDELAESLRLLKPEGNLFRDRYRSFVERGVVEGRFSENRKGRKFPVKYVEKYDYKHWGKYYGK